MKSKELYKEACEFIPGGVNSPVRAFYSVRETPRFIRSAKGARLRDEDDREYIDYVCSWGPLILGHAREEVVDSVKRAVTDGLTFGAVTQKETELARLICEAMSPVEMVRLVSSGTEAVMSAIRLARGFTGRDIVIKFAGCYHGHSDGMLVEAGSGALTYRSGESGETTAAAGRTVSSSAGIPDAYASCTRVADYNDIASVRRIFEECGENIAAVIVEPVAANMGVILPADGFLDGLRKLCDANGALLIFDEVITGFRLGPGGACGYYGIAPDLVTLGKIVGGGMPLAAFGGRRDIMERLSPLGDVYQAGTLAGNPVAVAAGLETLRILMSDPGIYSRLEEKAARLKRAYDGKTGISVNQVGSLLGVFFTGEKEVSNYDQVKKCDAGQYADYFSYMLANGIYVAPSPYEAIFVSDAHGEEEIRRTVETVEKYGN